MSPLFKDFDPIGKEAWKNKAEKDLKGAEFEKLVWRTLEGFNVDPFYTREDLKELDYLKEFENITDQKADTLKSWINNEKITVKDVNQSHQLASEAIHGGANGLIFEFTEPEKADFNKLLEGFDLNHISISLLTKESPDKLLQKFFDYIQGSNINIENVKGSLEYDPLGTYTITGSLNDQQFKALADAVNIAKKAPNFYAVTINSSHFKNSGASIVQELAFTLNSAVNYIDKLSEAGLSVNDIIKNIQFSLSVGTDYFMEIAKLKSIRILFTEVAKAFEIANYNPGDIQIHCFTSLWSKTIFDPSVNLLRDTTIAMAAVIGGCNSLNIEPYDADFKNPRPFLRRIARNVSTIIRDESYLDKVVDPVAGSYYIENLIDNQVKNAWEIFQEIESNGGFTNAFNNGIIQKKIGDIRDQKLSRIASRRDVIVGTNQYPNIKESIDPNEVEEIKYESGDGVELLHPQRGAREFEELRLDTEKYVKEHGETQRPKVFLAEYGERVTMRKARATFSLRFFGTSGFDVIEGTPFDSLDKVAQEVKRNDAKIIVLCAADEDYAEMGEAFAKKLKMQFADKYLVLAGYPKDIVENLKNAGFDEFIHIKSDSIAVLRDFQKKLNII